MPTYQYACTECGGQLEVVQKFTDDALTVHDACGGRLRKVFSPVGIVFKGSGFYRTDSRSGPSGASSTPAPASSGSATGSSAAAASGDKPAASGDKAAPAASGTSGTSGAAGSASAPGGASGEKVA